MKMAIMFLIFSIMTSLTYARTEFNCHVKKNYDTTSKHSEEMRAGMMRFKERMGAGFEDSYEHISMDPADLSSFNEVKVRDQAECERIVHNECQFAYLDLPKTIYATFEGSTIFNKKCSALRMTEPVVASDSKRTTPADILAIEKAMASVNSKPEPQVVKKPRPRGTAN